MSTYMVMFCRPGLMSPGLTGVNVNWLRSLCVTLSPPPPPPPLAPPLLLAFSGSSGMLSTRDALPPPPPRARWFWSTIDCG